MADDQRDDPPLTPAQRWVLAVADAQAGKAEHLLRMAFLFEADHERAARLHHRLYARSTR